MTQPPFGPKGGNFVDTASVRTRGHSEKILGDLATKFHGNLYAATRTAAARDASRS